MTGRCSQGKIFVVFSVSQESHKHQELQPKNTLHRTRTGHTLSPSPALMAVPCPSAVPGHLSAWRVPHVQTSPLCAEGHIWFTLLLWCRNGGHMFDPVLSVLNYSLGSRKKVIILLEDTFTLPKPGGCHSVNWSKSVLLEGTNIISTISSNIPPVSSKSVAEFVQQSTLFRLNFQMTAIQVLCYVLCLGTGEEAKPCLLEFVTI